MRTTCILLIVLTVPVDAQVSRVASTEARDAVPGFDSAGAISLPAANLEVDVTFPRGKKQVRELTVIFHPGTGFYVWHCTPPSSDRSRHPRLRLGVAKAQRAVVFVDTTRAIDFILGDGLFAKVWQRRAASLDAAVSSSIAEVHQAIPIAEGIGFGRDYQLVPMFGTVGTFAATMPLGHTPISRDFLCDPDQAFCPNDKSRIVSITKPGGQYRLLLRNRFDVEVLVGENLELISARQLTQPDAPKPRPFPFK